MAYFPFFVDITGLRCVIAGGGTVAYRKIQVLLEYGPSLTVIAPEVIPQISDLGGRIEVIRRKIRDEDIDGAFFVVAATGDGAVNRHLSELCRGRRIPVNVVDVKEDCSFIFPALLKAGEVTVGISTGGSSPAAARYLKKHFQEAIPDCFGELSETLGSYREFVKARSDSQKVRAAVFQAMVSLGISQQGHISREQVEELIVAMENIYGNGTDRN